MVEPWSVIRPDGDTRVSDREGCGLALCTLFGVGVAQKAGSESVVVRLFGQRRARSGSVSRSDRSVTKGENEKAERRGAQVEEWELCLKHGETQGN
jgi:hypothetical protein